MEALIANDQRPQENGARSQPVAKVASLPLAQRRLWFFDKLRPGSPLFNNAHGIRLRGALDVDRLRRALEGIVGRHETLRMHFADSPDGPRVHVHAEPAVDLPLLDLSDLNADGARAGESRGAGNGRRAVRPGTRSAFPNAVAETGAA